MKLAAVRIFMTAAAETLIFGLKLINRFFILHMTPVAGKAGMFAREGKAGEAMIKSAQAHRLGLPVCGGVAEVARFVKSTAAHTGIMLALMAGSAVFLLELRPVIDPLNRGGASRLGLTGRVTLLTGERFVLARQHHCSVGIMIEGGLDLPALAAVAASAVAEHHLFAASNMVLKTMMILVATGTALLQTRKMLFTGLLSLMTRFAGQRFMFSLKNKRSDVMLEVFDLPAHDAMAVQTVAIAKAGA
jgi:hypothetical protein